MVDVLYTIGHSRHSIDRFVELLDRHAITAIADVRSTPYSARHPQFNRENLEICLGDHGIGYVFLGNQLGARPDDPTCYQDGTVQYERLAATGLFHEGLTRVRNGAHKYRLALLCAEADPLECHRFVLICRRLKGPNIQIHHILMNGALESQDESEQRLLEQHGLTQRQLFLDSEGIVDRAYELQEKRIAYSTRPARRLRPQPRPQN